MTGLVSLATVGLLMPIPRMGRATPALGDMVHAPMFAGLTLAMLCFWQLASPTKTFLTGVVRSLIVAIAILSFGAFTEYVQGVSGRTASLHDLVADGLGIIAALGLVAVWMMRRLGWLSRMTMVLGCTAALTPIAFSWVGPLATLNDITAMYREFPLLSSFERKAELERWFFAKCSSIRVKEDVTEGDWALEINYDAGEHPTATLYEIQEDWSKADRLVLDATLVGRQLPDDESVTLAVQIIDAHHDDDFGDICRKEFTLDPAGTTRVSLPKDQWITSTGRPLDQSNIKFLDLQLVRPKVNQRVRVDGIRLELGAS